MPSLVNKEDMTSLNCDERIESSDDVFREEFLLEKVDVMSLN